MARAAKDPEAVPKARRWKCQGVLEQELRARGFHYIAGADEVGRGSLFGAVVAGAVILAPGVAIRGLNDSKQIEPERREVLAGRIRERALAWAVAAVDAATIDRINIYEASRLAMKTAVEQLNPAADFVLVDAVPLELPLPQQPLVQGDERCHAIAAASIVAKVYRDQMMREWDKFYPEYGLKNHKGYQSPEHMAAIKAHGPTPLHRFSFEPVRRHALFSPLPRDRQMEMFASA
ncbi:MAG TPA: ribonuclease HII [Bryobacteraceae bacterium]|jgi:ribonuclease HII|nr:ribonuclease HII [Bryobacteraceae bacterium]